MTELSNKVSVSRDNIRQIIRKRRRLLSSEQQSYFSQQAAIRIMAYPPITVARTVAIFLSFDGEIDTKPFIDQLWRTGKRCYLPVLHPFSSGNLLFLHYHSQSILVMNHLKIYEPKLDIRDVLPVNQLDVIVVPMTAFDEKGHRLGMGGGFYDRTLQNWKKYELHLVGYAHDFQIVKKIPAKKWDLLLPVVVTPSKLWIW